jgi:hypothetical protein
MATEKRLIDAIKHRLECHIAKAIYWGIDDIPMGKDSSSAFEFLRGYERGATETANIVLGMIPIDAVEVVHSRFVRIADFGDGEGCFGYCEKCGTVHHSQSPVVLKADYRWCRWCGAKMNGDWNG